MIKLLITYSQQIFIIYEQEESKELLNVTFNTHMGILHYKLESLYEELNNIILIMIYQCS